ncbi:hypothetical protein IFM89_027584 [Coptis chinensis]|uniref:J domain-containing protein n=1 Tax=Coptis chinensis TaxID=261450 RepID=A0A835M751_9MAGN|nr:hypothetical protein IFM89_027584 [Coptis chinensis]
MEIEIDHYEILGLPSGEEGSKLTLDEIKTAYKKKSLKIHPDKNLNNPNAATEFKTLSASYKILKDEAARKLYDDLLRVRRGKRQRQVQYEREKQQREATYGVKRRTMMNDLEERERASFAVDPVGKAREEEERIARRFREEVERIRAMHAKKSGMAGRKRSEPEGEKRGGNGNNGLDGEKVLKVSWEGNEDAYSAERLKELFKEFGEVEDVVIRSNKKRRTRSALVVMANKDSAVFAMGSVCGDLKNPLLVMPLNKAAPVEGSSVFPPRHVEPEPYIPVANNLVGASYQAKEASILDKLMKEVSAICFCLPQSSPFADLPLHRWYNLLGQYGSTSLSCIGTLEKTESIAQQKKKQLWLYNTLGRQKQVFEPKNPGKVGMYVCGVTAYDLSHIGHARVYISFDVLFRYLKHLEYEVYYVRNATDVDDKIIARANELGEDPLSLSRHYFDEFRCDMSYLHCISPSVEPHVSDHMPQIIDMIKQILGNGCAYRVDGDVYFSVDKFPEYGQLSGRKLEDNRAGERVTVDSRKRNPADFAL